MRRTFAAPPPRPRRRTSTPLGRAPPPDGSRQFRRTHRTPRDASGETRLRDPFRRTGGRLGDASGETRSPPPGLPSMRGATNRPRLEQTVRSRRLAGTVPAARRAGVAQALRRRVRRRAAARRLAGGSPSQAGRSRSTSVTAAGVARAPVRPRLGRRRGGRSQSTSSAAGFGGSGRCAARTRAPATISAPAASSAPKMPHWMPIVAPGPCDVGLVEQPPDQQQHAPSRRRP